MGRCVYSLAVMMVACSAYAAGPSDKVVSSLIRACILKGPIMRPTGLTILDKRQQGRQWVARVEVRLMVTPKGSPPYAAKHEDVFFFMKERGQWTLRDVGGAAGCAKINLPVDEKSAAAVLAAAKRAESKPSARKEPEPSKPNEGEQQGADVPATGRVPLKLYWSSARTDNYSVATADGERDAQGAGYVFGRVDGYILAAATNGTVPLKQYISPNGRDYFITGTECAGSCASHGYRFVRVEGHVYRAQQPGTVPLKNFRSDARGDSFVTATEKGERDAIGAGYRFVRIEGYAFPAGPRP